MNYENIIIRVLSEAGSDGLSVSKIVLHVYNASNTFFDRLSIEDIHEKVYKYLSLNSKKNNSLIQKTNKRGVYRLNDNVDVQQLLLDFHEDNEKAGDSTATNKDLSSSLF